MRVLMTGATGVIGRLAVPKLIGAGHHVTGVSRSADGTGWLESLGATAVLVDLFDADQVDAAVEGQDAVVHFATSIPSLAGMARRESWVVNDRLRSESTALLIDAGIRHGLGRFVLESVTFVYADGGDRWLTEDSPVDPPWVVLESALTAEGLVERFTAAGGVGIALRLARLYGPGRVSSEYIAAIRARKAPVIGSGRNFVSSLYVDDAASAVVAAMRASAGVYNISDDEPVTSREYASSLAAELDVRAPRRLPRWLARRVVGDAVGMLTASHRVDHAKFTDATGWVPEISSVREGWQMAVTAPNAAL